MRKIKEMPLKQRRSIQAACRWIQRGRRTKHVSRKTSSVLACSLRSTVRQLWYINYSVALLRGPDDEYNDEIAYFTVR